MSDDQVRVACPACGRRFRMPLGAVPDGGPGKEARCRGCGAPFVVGRTGDELTTTPGEAKPPASTKKPSTRGAMPVRSRRRPRANGGKAHTTGGTAGRPSKPPSTGSGQRDVVGTTTASGAGQQSEPTLPPSGVGGTPFGIGDRLGRYEIEGVLARGGMGGIYKAYDPAANRHVALKVLVSSATDLDKLRFQREIQVQGNVQHPHIMPIFDSGVIGTTRYYTMELLKDPLDLIELTELARSGEAAKDPKLRPIATIEGLVERIVNPICQAIHHANVNEGVLHRDLKPGNVLLDRNGLRPFVIDFGVSALLEKKNARLAHLDRELPVPLSGKGISITGTLVFMPPEQARGEAHRRGDVWAIGALLHYFVTGEPPLANAIRPVVSREERVRGLRMLIDQSQKDGKFSEAREFEAQLEAILAGTERTVEDLRRDVLRGHYTTRPPGTPKSLDAIIERALMPDPEQRYRHGLDLKDDLSAWLEGRPVRALVKSSGAAGGVLYRAGLFARRHKALLAILFAVGALVFAGLSLTPKQEDVDRARLSQQHMDRALSLESKGDAAAARRAAREALRFDPDRNDAFALMARLDAAARLSTNVRRARTLATEARAAFLAKDIALAGRRLAALDEVVRNSVLPSLEDGVDDDLQDEMNELLRFAQGTQPIRVTGAPPGCRYELFAIEGPGGPVRWDRPIEVPSNGVGLSESARITAGQWVLRIRRQKGQLYLPFQAEAGGDSVTVACPIDPARIGAGSVYVGAGRAAGPGRPEPVSALVWDRTELTAAKYAEFLATLSAEEQRRRVPRLAGALGALGEPLWDRMGEAFKPPASARRRPVEGISLYDARAYAKFAQKRLPTAAEWAWAASGPDGRPCAVGAMRDLLAGVAHIDRPLAGVADCASSAGDRSPFGLFDMAGNVAEFTATLGSRGGESGWFVMGASYLTPASHALVNEARVAPGWMPLQGVGLRCVREVK